MIEPMKRVTVVCLQADRASALHELRRLGIVHVTDVRPPESADLSDLLRRQERCQRALGTLAVAARGQPAAAATVAGTPGVPVEATVETVLRAAADSARADEELTHLARMAAQLEPWGGFSRERLAQIRAGGIEIVFGMAPQKQLPAVPADAALHVVRARGGVCHFIVVAPAGVALGAIPQAPLPEITDPAELVARQNAAATRRTERLAELVGLTPAEPALRAEGERLAAEIEFARARDGMGQAGTVAYLQGYVPAKDMERLVAVARRHGWAVQAREPAEDDGQVPTCLTLPRWVEPIRVVIDGIGLLPGYREVDISACFLVFFSVFFAMLIGDAAYGVIFLGLTLWLRRRFPRAPAQPFWMFGILSACTILWGVLNGTYFGLVLPDGSLLQRLSLDVLVNADTGERNVQRLCFFIGAVHLTLAHLWNAWLQRRSLKSLGQFAWIAVLWGNFFLAGQLVLDLPAPPVTRYLFGAGMAGIVLFTEPQRNVFKAVGSGLMALVLGIVNSFIDVVSYIRLFAVGFAGLAIERSFTDMATGLAMPTPLKVLVGAVILIAGHGLNMALGGLGVLVHGVRLNVLEFAGHLGLGFSGVPYRPFRLKDAAKDKASDARAAGFADRQPQS